MKKPPRKKPRKSKLQVTLLSEVCGEELRGRVVGGRWRFESSIPGMVEQLDGSAECAVPGEVFARIARAGRNPIAAVKQLVIELRTLRAKGGVP